MARSTDAAFVVPDDCTNAAAVGLQVNEFGFQRPASVGRFVAKVQEALVDFNVLLAFNVGGFKLVHGFEV
jgi:hypothetical protein